MAKDLMFRRYPRKTNLNSGFSLIEMLVAAFIMAFGILGILMLQMIAIRATRGTGNMGAAARISGQILDQAEMEGRLSWLNITDGNTVAPTLSDLSGFSLKYITIKPGESLTEEFNIKGDPIHPDNEDALANVVFFRVVTSRASINPSGAVNAVGAISDFQVRVSYTDEVGADKQPIARTFSLSRRIIHG